MIHLEMSQVTFVNGMVKFWRLDIKRIESVKNSALLLTFIKNNRESSYTAAMKDNLKPDVKSDESPPKF